MKKFLIVIAGLIIFNVSFGQSEKYLKAMKANVAAVDTVQTAAGWSALANNFQRIADTEKSQWQPYYYSALGTVLSAMIQTMGKQGWRLLLIH